MGTAEEGQSLQISHQKVIWPDHLTCLLRNLYASQEATVRTGHGTTDWFQIGKGVRWGCILSPCLFNLCAEYIVRNVGLEEAQAGIKIAGRNINNLRYADDTHPYGRKWRGTKKPLDESERGLFYTSVSVAASYMLSLWERERVGWFGRMVLKYV